MHDTTIRNPHSRSKFASNKIRHPIFSPHDPGALLKLSDDLAALVRRRLLEAFDDRGIIRYRPVRRYPKEISMLPTEGFLH